MIYIFYYIIYIYLNSCRHAFFADYFGDKKPQCIDKCDVCCNKEAVKADLDSFMLGLHNISHTIMSNKQLVSSDIYGGGRNAVKEYFLNIIISIVPGIILQYCLGKLNVMHAKEIGQTIKRIQSYIWK